MTPVSAAPLIQALLTCPDCYDHPVTRIELIETHISWVLLTGEYAYKIKKPVNLGFLNFSTVALRRQDCEDEVRLNRRLAPACYLGVIPISGSPDMPRLNGPGEPIEYAVKMRQFPPEATLDQLAERGELGIEQIDRLAARLAHFHLSECEPAPAGSPWGEPDTIAGPVEENFKLLMEKPGSAQQLQRIQDWSITEHRRLEPLMRERKRSGRVRECHGDLHLGNLAWIDGELLIFDCLEFNAALRWIDIISEVAFCYMDLLHRQQPELAARFLNAWLEITGDYDGVALLRYYAVYRAMVRAKVAALRGVQIVEESETTANRAELDSCLQLAERLSQCEPPQLWITHGLSGSGKTTLTQSLLQSRSMIRLRSDVERKRLAGLDALARSGEDIGAGLYSQSASRNTYLQLASLAAHLLKAGWPVVVDAACLERWQRDLFHDLAHRLGATFRILDIQADPATLRERIAKRTEQGRDASDASMNVLQHQIETREPLAPSELANVTVIAQGELPKL
ncbi:MAG TPA: AAA family ATPase [Gallionella sp.]|nr:AAA family ATPase [Gallionella sp.]